MDTKELLGLPWSLSVSPDVDERGRYFVAAVAEIPGVHGYGATDVEARADLYDALRDAINSMLRSGEEVPAPARWTGEMVENHVPGPLNVTRLAIVSERHSDNTGTIYDPAVKESRVELGHATPA